MGRLLALTVALVLGGCALPPSPGPQAAVPADAGHHSFVRQAVPILLGRRIRGHDEIRLLADLAAATDRGTVVRGLMDQPEFVDHWAEHLVDRLRVHRESAKAHGDCYGDPLRSASDLGSTARIMAGRPAASGPIVGAPPFNMTDVIRSALEADNLSVIYRAHLFALVDKPPTGNEITEQNVRDDLGVTFGNVYANRQIGCLRCHNSQFSLSGEGSGWDRSHPIPGTFEQSVFGSSSGRDAREVHALFRSANKDATPVTVANNTDPATIHDRPAIAAQSVRPWGMERCGAFHLAVPDDPLGAQAFLVRSYGLQGRLFDLEESIWRGVEFLDTNGLNRVGSSLTNDDAALAFLVAANIVDETWTAVMGSPLTIAINLPRNADQQAVLWNLTEALFIRIHWSLKYLLRRILTSEHFNRLSPGAQAGLLPAPGQPAPSTGYDMPLLFDPWVQADPRCPPESPPGPVAGSRCWPPGPPPPSDPGHSAQSDPERHFNAMTESVHRYSPRTLLGSVAAALGWNRPSRFPGSGYPDVALTKAIGQFATDAQPGFSGVDFQGLLHWEAEHGVCDKTGKTAGDDWIDRVVAAVPAFDAAHSTAPATLGDLVVTLKDWLLGDSRIVTSLLPPSEAQALADLLGAPLATPAAGVPDLGTRLRRACGVMLQSPQFMLAGIAPRELGPAPRLRVCNGEPCTYRAMCEQLRPAIERQRWQLTCNDDDVTARRPPPPPPPTLDPLCPRGRCIVLPLDVRLECSLSGARCPRFPPSCDIRCTGLTCCGDPQPSIDEDGLLLGWAEGGRVERAVSVTILPAGGEGFTPLASGRVLRAGDLLRLPPGSHLAVQAGEGGFATDRQGAPGRPGGAILFMVTGPTALQVRTRHVDEPRVPPDELAVTDRKAEFRWGEAGPARVRDGTAPAGPPRVRTPSAPAR
jgi:hypothetical protein